MSNLNSNFYVIAHEAGAENSAIPCWANRDTNPLALDPEANAAIERHQIENVPGAFQLLNVLTTAECERIVELSESLGYLEDAAVSLPRAIRHNDSFTWVVDDATNDIIWQRCQALLNDNHEFNAGKRALGINARFRFYRYGPGDFFAPHTDGSWPGSRVIDGELVDNAYNDRWSQLSFLLFLSGDYEGGSTQFYVSPDNSLTPARRPDDAVVIDVRTPVGGALCFPHGVHPLHCMHASREITAGTKYIIRSDILFDL
ncbi:MAG: 2OG-Fe(II) oxygenase [Gammaproteobacteria bacterium]|nr:2OG-Fe(II) oxygenase [Gammaproteobacteria bacterium]